MEHQNKHHVHFDELLHNKAFWWLIVGFLLFLGLLLFMSQLGIENPGDYAPPSTYYLP